MTTLPGEWPLDPTRFPPVPKPFHMSEPFHDRGVWFFWLSADDPVIRFVGHLHCILPLPEPNPYFRRPQSRALIGINPRYDHQEAWLWIYDLLGTEAHYIDLDDEWENAINEACDIEADDA